MTGRNCFHRVQFTPERVARSLEIVALRAPLTGVIRVQERLNPKETRRIARVSREVSRATRIVLFSLKRPSRLDVALKCRNQKGSIPKLRDMGGRPGTWPVNRAGSEFEIASRT